jgi:hypothetical protein
MPDIILLGIPPLAIIFGALVGAIATEETVRVIRRVLWVVVGLFTLDIAAACAVVRLRFDSGYRDVILQLAILLAFYCVFALFAGLALMFRAGRRRAGLAMVIMAILPVPTVLIAGVIQKAL